MPIPQSSLACPFLFSLYKQKALQAISRYIDPANFLPRSKSFPARFPMQRQPPPNIAKTNTAAK